MSRAPLLSVEAVAAGYGKKEILHGVNLSVEKGETIALIGPNGAGKSTILLTILGYLKPTAGRIVLGGEDVTGLDPHQMIGRGVGFCPQRRNIFPDMTVDEHLDLAAWTIKNAGKARTNRAHIESMFPLLKERGKQKAQTLSGGQRQMLTLGMALMTSPALLLLDEPTIGLAPLVIDSVFQNIDRIAEQGVSLLIVEQNAAKALAHSHRAYVLETGQNRHDGSSAALLADPTVRRMYLGG